MRAQAPQCCAIGGTSTSARTAAGPRPWHAQRSGCCSAGGWSTSPGAATVLQSSCSAGGSARHVAARALVPVAHAAASSASGPAAPGTGGSGGQGVKRLILLRHAESESRSQTRDHDRPLSNEGRQQALDIATRLQGVGWLPDLVLASNAKRTRQTLDEMATVMARLGDVDAHFYGSLYTVAALDGQTRSHLQDCLLEVVDDARHQCVLLVGHNKGWEEAASSFAGCAVKLRTASAALLQAVAGSWTDVLNEEAQWQLVDVLVPSGAASDCGGAAA